MAAGRMQEPVKTSKKRKVPDSSGGINVNINIGSSGGSPYSVQQSNIVSDEVLPTTKPPAKKPKTTAAKGVLDKKSGVDDPVQPGKKKTTSAKAAATANKPTAGKTPSANSELAAMRAALKAGSAYIRKLQTAEKKRGPSKESKAEKESAPKSSAVQTASNVKKETGVKKETS
ncbi:MAG: hypothetical protein Q9222_007918, partial [Ikaeria aurantiellina]